jgi:argininosuccinate synthase
MPRYAELIYYGFWFAPEREMLQAAIDKSQEFVTGSVRGKRRRIHCWRLWDLTTFPRDGPPSHRNRDFAVFAEIGRFAGDPGLEEFKCSDGLAGRSIPQLCG